MNKKDYVKGIGIAFESKNHIGWPYNVRGRIVKWRWDFGDGGVSEEQNPTHFYKEPGTYPVKLTIEDGCGQKDSTINSTEIPMWNERLILREMCMGKTEEEYEGMEKMLTKFLDEIEAGGYMLEWKWGELGEDEKGYYAEKYPEVISAMVSLKLGSSE